MIREKLTSEKVHIRILYLSILFVIVFFGLTVLSYFILPEGFLLNQNKFKNFETSSNLLFSTLQIFLFNMISIAFVIIGSCFAKKKEKHQNYMSLGYWCFIVCISINAVTLGTWSFSSQTESVPLAVRMIGMFNMTKNAGLIEMFGQLLITCSFANKYLVMTYKRETQTRKMKDIKCTKQEMVFLIWGIVLMFIGAMIESNSIIALRTH